MKYNQELNNIAKEHCEYLYKNGTTGETNEYNIFFRSLNIVYGINTLKIFKNSYFDTKENFSKLYS